MSRNILIANPYDPPGSIYTREMRCQEKKEILGTSKPPLTPALLAALLERNGVSFRTAENLPANKIQDLLKSEHFVPDIVLFPTCTPTVTRDMAFAAELKQYTGAELAAFGPHTSGIPVKTLEQFVALDIAIVGEPEETVLEIAAGDKPRSEIKGIAFRDSSNIVKTEKRAGVADLDSLPMPAWSHFNLAPYRVPLFGKKFLIVELSRGCPYSCSFCVVPLTHGNRLREKSPAKIVEEIKFMKEKYGVSFFYFWGDTAVMKRPAMMELLDRIISDKLDIQWISNTRPEAIQDEDFARKLRLSGCRMLSMGAESGDPAVLETMHKKLDIQALRRAVAILRKTGIRTFVFFIFGYPGESLDTMDRTMKLALSLDPDYANFYPAVPYPGTPLWDYCLTNNLLTNNDWEKIDFHDYILRMPGMPPGKVLEMVRSARKKFYMRPRYILKTMRDFSSPQRAMDIIRAVPAYLNT